MVRESKGETEFVLKAVFHFFKKKEKCGMKNSLSLMELWKFEVLLLPSSFLLENLTKPLIISNVFDFFP